MAAKNSAADVAALDSNVQGSGVLRIVRRTDITVRRLSVQRQRWPKVPALDEDAQWQLALTGRRRGRLLALWASGELNDEEYLALSHAA